jgi:hypothetical protein
MNRPFPFRALHVRPVLRRGSFSDSCGVVAVDVLRIEKAQGAALVSERCGSVTRKIWVPFSELATTPEKAAEKLRPALAELSARPLFQMAGMTADSSAQPEVRE